MFSANTGRQERNESQRAAAVRETRSIIGQRAQSVERLP